MPKRKDRVIIDTNIWLSFLLTRDFSRLDKLFADKSIMLLFSQELLDEFIEVAKRPKFKKYFTTTDLYDLLEQIQLHGVFIKVFTVVNLCRDPKDNFLLSLAKDGKATHLLTGDKDLLDLNKFGKTYILTITNYINERTKGII
jgi:putative PIN family toxin of toxin-antitoxin system